MNWTTCPYSSALPPISRLFINLIGHDTYQIKAEYLSYRMVLIIILLVLKNMNI